MKDLKNQTEAVIKEESKKSIKATQERWTSSQTGGFSPWKTRSSRGATDCCTLHSESKCLASPCCHSCCNVIRQQNSDNVTRERLYSGKLMDQLQLQSHHQQTLVGQISDLQKTIEKLEEEKKGFKSQLSFHQSANKVQERKLTEEHVSSKKLASALQEERHKRQVAESELERLKKVCSQLEAREVDFLAHIDELNSQLVKVVWHNRRLIMSLSKRLLT